MRARSRVSSTIFCGVVHCAALLLVSAPPVEAQGAGGATLRGTILDSSGGVLPGVSLVLSAVRTRTVRETTSDASGSYAFPALTPGPYVLRARVSGFEPWQSDEVQLRVGDSLHLDAILGVAAVSEAVTVTAERQTLRSDHGAREGVITAQQIENLSIVSRSAMELLRILPGTVAPEQSSLEVVAFALGGANDLGDYSVNGTRGTTINPVLDGSKIVDFGANSSVMLNMNADMVEEVKVQSGNYAAEYGTSGVQVAAITKSGSASFHGSVYDYWRTWRLAANDRSNSYAGVPRPENDFHYPGFTLSGPVLIPGSDFNRDRDELFFFVGFELQRQTRDDGTSLSTVPTLAQRQGDFSELLTGQGQNLRQGRTVTIPAGFPGAGQPAPNNDLSPYIDPVGQSLLNLFPLPNYTDSESRYNYAFNPQVPIDRWQLTTRLDWNVTRATRAYLRLALEAEENQKHRLFSPASIELPSAVAADHRAWSAALNVSSVLGSDMTNELVLSASRLELDWNWADPSRMTLEAQGLEGYRGLFPSRVQEPPLGIQSWGQGLASLDGSIGFPFYADNDSLSIADTLTKVVGAHTAKLGVFVERGRKQQSGLANTVLGLAGPWTPGGTTSDYGDLLVGRPFYFYEQTLPPAGEWRFWNFEGFVQDSWKVRRNLTLELGLRAAKLPNNEELTGIALRFEPSEYDPSQGLLVDGDPERPNGVLLARRGEIPNGTTRDPGLKLMPRVNFAWDLRGDGDIVLRGGSGLFYNRVQGNFQYEAAYFAPNAYSAGVTAWDVPGGLTIGGLAAIDPFSHLASTNMRTLDPGSVHVPRTWNWSLALAKRLPWNQTLEVAYVGSRSDHLPNRTPADYIPPGSLTGNVGNADLDDPLHRAAMAPSVVASFRSFPAYGSVDWAQFEAWSRYHALQATLSRTASRGFSYFVNYTFSRSRGAGLDDFATIDPIEPELRSVGVLYGDRPHIFNASWSLDLPDPIGSAGNGFLRQLLNGWQLSGITTYRSGLPYRIFFRGELDTEEMQRAWWGTDAHLSGGVNNAGSITPVYLGDPRTGNTGVGEDFIDIDMLGIPAFGESGPFQRPYDFRVPTRWNWDVTLFKSFELGGDKRLQLRLGVFNLFNQAAPDIRRGDLNFFLQTECNVRVDGVPNGAGGTADGVCDPSQGFHFTDVAWDNFGRIVTKRGRRVIELAARFDF